MEAVHEVLAVLRDVSESLSTKPPKTMLGDHQNIRKSLPPATADDAVRLKWCVEELERILNSNLFKRRGSSLQISDEEHKLVAAAKRMDRGSNQNVGDWILTYMDNGSTVENIAQQVHRVDQEDKNSIKQLAYANAKQRAKSLPNINGLGSETFDLDDERKPAPRNPFRGEERETQGLPSQGLPSRRMSHKLSERKLTNNNDMDDDSDMDDMDNGMMVERMPTLDLLDTDDDIDGIDVGNDNTDTNDNNNNDDNEEAVVDPDLDADADEFSSNPHLASQVVPRISEANLKILHLSSSEGNETYIAQRRVSTDSQINRGHLGYGLGVGEEDHTVASRTRLTASTQDVNDVPFANEMQDNGNPSPLVPSTPKRLSFVLGISPRPKQTSPLRNRRNTSHTIPTHTMNANNIDEDGDNNNSGTTSNGRSPNQLSPIRSRRHTHSINSIDVDEDTLINNMNNNMCNSINNGNKVSSSCNDISKGCVDEQEQWKEGCHALCSHAKKKYNESLYPALSAMPRDKVKRYLCGESFPKYANVINEFNEILLDVNEWNVDIFRLSALTDAPLALLGMKIFEERNLFEQLRLDRTTVINFFWRVEESYRHYPEIKFHNNMHAADVMHSAHFLLASLDGAFSDIEVFSAIVAAAVHDCQHFGRTNNFLMKTRHKLTMIYNDQSVLEMFHLSEAFKVVGDPTCDIFANFTQDEYLIIRKLVIDMVLSTDMAKHAKFLGEFRALQHDLEENFEVNPDSNENKVIAQLSESFSNRVLVLCAIVHNADLGNPTKKWIVCRTWAERLLEEFFEEGDAERELGLPLGALNDRNGVVAAKSQVGFLTYVVSPLWQAWSDYVNKFDGEEAPQLEALSENLKNWKEVAESTIV
eukprot:m.63503 g.63503  ORF g.63503 m.63503 type:complete len:872 (-) comp23292_c0_seq1:210-2825(-)